MYIKKCPDCGKTFYSSSRKGIWICECGRDLSEEKSYQNIKELDDEKD